VASGPKQFRPNVFISIDEKGIVELTIPRPEMGQGVRTGIAVLLADELGASLEQLRLRQADFDPIYGDQYVGGSSSMPGSWRSLRAAAAAAREMLVQAAATRWGVPPEQCDAREGSVAHAHSGRKTKFGILVREAASLPLPKEPRLRTAGTHSLLGGRHRALDAPDIVSGKSRFGLDTHVPGMLVAVIERAPVLGSKLATFDDTEAQKSRGVKAVVPVDPDQFLEFSEDSPKPAPGVAVIADRTWHALKGRAALRVQWSQGSADDSDALRSSWTTRTTERPHFVERADGDFDKAFAAAELRHEAVYEVPFLAHATMEPMNCVADVRGGRCEVWAPTQNPKAACEVAALVSGLPPSAVVIHPTRMGGGFGRRFYSDFVAEAVHLSKVVGAPVKVVWTREDDMQHGFFRPAGIHRLQAAVSGGRIAAWSHHLVNASRGTFLRWKHQGPELHPGEVDPTDFPANFVPHFRLAYSESPAAAPRGQWRAVEDSANAFVIQGFLDELAALAHRDPLELQLEMLANDVGPKNRRRAYDASRLRGVIEHAADRSSWGSRRGRGLGFAASFSHGAYVAEVAEVAPGVSSGIRIQRIVAAVDCGIPVNRLGIEAQVRGAIVYGLSAALHQQITLRAGKIEQGNFGDYPPLRIHEMPEIEVHIVESDARPAGVGEGALPPAAPAVANAVFALSGTRLRKLPLPI
jgi:isoquinoline 1-oxidoreductase beta subunit